MIVFIVNFLIIAALLILVTVVVVKICHSSRLKTWFKVFSSIFIFIIGSLLAFAGLLWVEYFGNFSINERSYPRSKDPKVALEYLDDIGINIQPPEFRVKHHSIFFEGGGGVLERWRIEFKQSLTESFKASLDSLLQTEPVRWRYDKRMVRRGMLEDEEEFYIFACRNPVNRTIYEHVGINITTNEATLIRRKY